MNTDYTNLTGAEVNYVRFSYQVDINFIHGTEGNWKYANLQLETPFELTIDDAARMVDPADLSTLTPLVGLVHVQVENISLSDDYELIINFANGTNLRACRAAMYEAWNLHGDEIVQYIATAQ